MAKKKSKEKATKKKEKVTIVEDKDKKVVKDQTSPKKFEYIEYKLKEDKLTEELVKQISIDIKKTKDEVERFFFGNRPVIDSLMRALICNGHILLEGVPGIAKTLVINVLGRVSGCTSKRIQFTVDLLPTDITGLTTYTPGKGFEIEKGPIFANFVIADEINRTPPKTQSAMIEAMQEKQVTIGKTTFALPKPFFVMATENPLEQEGVYPLPEAQVDRFLFKVIFGYPDEESEKRVMEENLTFRRFEDLDINVVLSPQKIIELQHLVHKVYLSPRVKDYIMAIVKKTREKDFDYGKYISLGSSPRAGIALYIAAKAQALIKGRTYVVPEDIKEVSKEILRHRIILTYRARAENVNTDKIVDEIIRLVK